MKHLPTIAFLALLFTVPLISGAFLDFFQGRSDGNNIQLEWKTRAENSVQVFELQRRAGWQGEYLTIATMEPKGSNSFYEYVDRSAYKQQDNVYTYRLRIVDAGGPAAYSNEVSVSHSVSSVKRTWGSIKAMFR
ncbi:MAG: hypothetical protein IPP94_06345 [Ignavibacteria bacterium]|nr:hypothetical protein [Ignavibacteria bacterium]